MIDLSLDGDAAELATAVTDLLKKAAPLGRFRNAESENQLAGTLAQFGWFAMAASSDSGGLGIGLVEQALIHVEAGRHLVSPSTLAALLAAQFGPVEMRRDLLAGAAGAAFVIAADSGGIFAVDPRSAALLVSVDGPELRFYSSADFRGQAIDGLDESLETQKGGFIADPVAVAHEGARATLLLTAMLTGTASGAAQIAIEYAKVREQFGQPIGAFQAVKHRCADMGVAAFAAEAQVVLAAAALTEGAPSARLELAGAAVQAIKAARTNGAGAIQVHGGMGFTAECNAHRYLKRGHVITRLIGDERAFTGALLELTAN